MNTQQTLRARRAAVLALGGAATAALSVGLAPPAAAHERWFVENTPGGDWGFFFKPLPLALTAAVVVATVVWRLIAQRLPSPELPPLRRLARLAPSAPRMLAVVVGIALVALAATGKFLAPSIDLDRVAGAPTAIVVEVAVGLWFISGRWLRVASAVLAALVGIVGVVAGPVALLESGVLLGVAGFLAVVAPWKAPLRGPAPAPAQLRVGLLVLRGGIALSLVTLAFSEKLTNPELAQRTLTAYPQLDLPALLGLPLSHETFIAFAAAAELLFGLLLLSGAMPQVTVLMAAVPFTATLPLFGLTELIGHLPVYGVFLTLLVYGSTSATAAGVPWIPRQREAVEDARPAMPPCVGAERSSAGRSSTLP